MFLFMPKQSPETNSPAGIIAVAAEIEEIAGELRAHAAALEGLSVKRFWGGSENGRTLGLTNFRNLLSEIRNAVKDMAQHDANGILSDLSDTDSQGKIYRKMKAQNVKESKASDKRANGRKPSVKRT
jgi:hypothetical protein